jgi:hypothetical protein
MQTKRKKTEHETKVEFGVISVRLHLWAEELRTQNPAPLDKIDLVQRAAAAMHFMAEQLYGPFDEADISGGA